MAVEHAVADTGDNGERLFLSALTTINRAIAWTCARNHVSHEDAEEFGSHVRLKLIEENYAIIRKFQGRSALRTYLTVVIQRLFLDFRISAWGKWRPSAEAKRGGALAMLLEQLLVRDGHTFDEACQLLATKYGIAAEDAELERVASRFPMRVKRRFESDDRLVEMPTAGIDRGELLMRPDWQTTAGAPGHVVCTAKAAPEASDRL